MFKKLFKAFNLIKWWELGYLLVSLSIILAIGIVFKSNAYSILFSILNILVIFSLGKGWVLGNVIGVFASIFYIFISLASRLYGEVIMSVVFGVPTYIISLYFWMKHRHTKTIVQVNKISIKEWFGSCFVIAIFGVGLYYFLAYFNTAFVVLSTISSTIGLLARYMQMRRSEYNFLCYIIVNSVGTVLWTCVAVTNITNITTAITYAIQALMNSVAFINWLKLKRIQKRDYSFDIIKRCCLEKI